MASQRPSILCAFGLVLTLTACAPEAPPPPQMTFAPPVGVEMGASGDVPALTLAISLSRGAALDSVVEPLTTAVHAGLRACPSYVKAAATGDLEGLNLTLTRKTLMMAPSAAETDATRCMAEQIGASQLSTPEDLKLKARVQVLFKETEARRP